MNIKTLTRKDTQQLANSHAPNGFTAWRVVCIEIERSTFYVALFWCNSGVVEFGLMRVSVERGFDFYLID
tara:strand:- start:568 stop:777 length:210 start_codon:yes stop_codon:yes gene_type:complete